jgi:Zn-dependent protease
MNKSSFSLGRVFGIPLDVDYSWFLIFALVTWTLATGYFPSEFRNWPAAEYWIIGLVTAILFFLSVLLHELGHSLVALMYKIPVRSITLLIFGGVSEISKEPPNPLSDFWITITGPAVNLALAGIFTLLAPLASGVPPLLAVLKYLSYINLLLGLFNLVPGFPLDGGGILMSIVWGITQNKHRGILVAGMVGSFFAYVFIVLGVFLVLNGDVLNGLWTAFVGWFMLNASSGETRRERLKSALEGHSAAEAMNRNYTIIQADTTLQSLVDLHILGGSRRSFIVEKEGVVVGLFTVHNLQMFPKEQWPDTTVDQVMVPKEKFIKIGPETDVWEAIEEMDQDGVNQLPVMTQGGQLVGMLTREDVISYLKRTQENKGVG